MQAFPSVEELRSWVDGLEELQERLAPLFARAEPRRRALAYLPRVDELDRAQKWLAARRTRRRTHA